MSSPEPWTYYKPVRRIRQACQNCRRKKVRCPGQRPECSFCLRLGQSCSYTDDQVPSWAYSVSAANQRRKTIQGSDKRSPAAAVQEQEAPQQEQIQQDHDESVADESPTAQLAAMQTQITELTHSLKTLESTVSRFTTQVAKIVSSTASSIAEPSPNHHEPTTMDIEASASSLQYIRLPPMHIIRSAADLYFRFCHNQPYSLFHEASLRHKIEANEVPAHLLFALVASTIRYSTDPFFEDKTAALAAYSQQSWKAIVMPWNGLQSELELSIVQTILLLAIIDYTEGRTQGSWIKVGLAIRLCQDFRLMAEPNPDFPAVHREERRRVFWSFYLCDKLISCGRERPATILDDHCRLQLPCDEDAWRIGSDCKTPTLEDLENDLSGSELSQLSPFAITVLITSLLGRCAQYALGEQEGQGNSGKLPPWNPRSKYSAIHSAILQHESELGLGELLSVRISKYFASPGGTVDQHSAAPVAFAHALFYLCQCLLYHPFLLRQRLAHVGQRTPQSFLAQNFNSCHHAASSLSRLMGDVRSQQSEVLTTSYDPFYGYCNIVAGVIHVIFLDSASQTVRETAAAAYEASLQNLENLSVYWRSCGMMRARLQEFRATAACYTALVDPTIQEVSLPPEVTNDLVESLDYAHMSMTPRRKSQTTSNSACAVATMSPGGSNGIGPTEMTVFPQLTSPFFEELVNLLPFSCSRPMTPRQFDAMMDSNGVQPPAPPNGESSAVANSLSFGAGKLDPTENYQMSTRPMPDSNHMGLP